MKSKWAAAAAILALLAGCHAKTEWQTFSPAGGNFSVEMPGAPADKSHTQNTANGAMTSHLFIYTAKDAAYAVSYVDRPAPKDGSDPEKWLDTVRDAEVAKSGGKLLAAATLKLGNGAPGREIQVTLTQGDGKHAMRDRLYLVDKRLYQVLVVVPQDQIDSDDTRKFLDSFRLQ